MKLGGVILGSPSSTLALSDRILVESMQWIPGAGASASASTSTGTTINDMEEAMKERGVEYESLKRFLPAEQAA